jgi:ABC-type branched-subunit amino acid transport system substrate-binding protein
VTGPVQVDTRAQTPAAYAAFASKVAQAHPDAVLFGASPGPGAVAVWSALHAAAPSVKLFAPSTLATPAFVAALGPAASATYVTSPVLQARFYPPAARRVLREYRSTFGVAPSVFALYGYEAMKAVLAAIRAAGRHGGNRRSVVRAFFALRNRSSVLGDYSVLADGDVTLARFGGYRVSAHGRLRFEQLLP